MRGPVRAARDDSGIRDSLNLVQHNDRHHFEHFSARLSMSGLSDRLGSRISVISKSQERFEGVLHKIDPNTKTVTLSEGKRSTARFPSYLSTSLLFVVKFHGTENRFVDEGHPTVSVKYAVFDKADLVVFEPPREKSSKTPEIVSPKESAPLATLVTSPPVAQHRSPSPPLSAQLSPPNLNAYGAYPLFSPQFLFVFVRLRTCQLAPPLSLQTCPRSEGTIATPFSRMRQHRF